MKIVQGNKKLDLSKKDFLGLIITYKRVFLDIGTGDGRFVYKSALNNKENFHIGLDPVSSQFKEYSKKAVRKKLHNILFVVGSAENMPKKLYQSIDEVFIIMPWGTLLQNLVLPSREFVNTLAKLVKPGGKLTIILGYSPEFEPSETKRLNLPKLSKNHLKDNLVKSLKSAGFKNSRIKQIDKDGLKALESTWSKKLAYGNIREMYELTMEK